jgi:hypothetical protein
VGAVKPPTYAIHFAAPADPPFPFNPKGVGREPPPAASSTTDRISGLSLIQRLMLVIGLAGLIAAAILALSPLPAATAFGAEVGWCGPGTASESALVVTLNPSSVNSGSSGTLEQQQAFMAYCEGIANSRLQWAGIVALASVIGAALAIWILGIPHRQGST